MQEIRNIGQYFLMYEPQMKMFILTDGENFSKWFGFHFKEDLMALSGKEFKEECFRLINENI